MGEKAKQSAVRASRSALALVFAVAVLSASAGAQHLFTDQQSGWVLKPKQVEVGGLFAGVAYLYGAFEDGEYAWSIYGLNLGYGLAKNVELRVRYGYFAGQDFWGDLSVFSFGPKIGLWKDRLAVIVPVGFVTGKDYRERSQTWNIQPGLIASFPVSRSFEITPSAKALIPLHSDPYGEYDTLMAVNLGLGFFATANRSLVIRPEIGLLIHWDWGSFFQVGIGISYCTKAKS